MIEITDLTIQLSPVIDAIARAVVPATIGVSTGAYGTIIHLPDNASPSDQSKLADMLANHGALTISADKTVMNEGDADPIVTCSDGAIASDPTIAYIVLLDGEIYASGTDAVTSGTAQLTLVAPLVGVYDIFIYRLRGNYASDSVRITVNEV